MNSVTILMSTYNGARFLSDQLDSLLKQEKVNMQILVRDDGSTDSTQKILSDYEVAGKLKWYTGENLRSAKSFMDLVQNALESDYYAFCDQDDVWKSDKLFKAVKKLQEMDSSLPLLYCADYQLVDENLRKLPDNCHISTIKFGAALVASNATGCTIVFNEKLLKILKHYSPEIMVMHDDWAHKVCLAVGGVVFYDDYKALYYRQHGKNVDGGHRPLRKRVALIKQRILSNECIRSRQVEEIIKGYSEMMSPENLKLAEILVDYKCCAINRIQVLTSKKIRTPYSRLNRGFIVAIMFGYF